MTTADPRYDPRPHAADRAPLTHDALIQCREGHPGVHPLIHSLQYVTKFTYVQLYAANCSSM